jgi:formate hydrogenlyase subunit 6/NADH:ubiquinone oxidoreductase subunit I
MSCDDCGAEYMLCDSCGGIVTIRERVDVFHYGKCPLCGNICEEPCPTRHAQSEEKETLAREEIRERNRRVSVLLHIKGGEV